MAKDILGQPLKRGDFVIYHVRQTGGGIQPNIAVIKKVVPRGLHVDAVAAYAANDYSERVKSTLVGVLERVVKVEPGAVPYNVRARLNPGKVINAETETAPDGGTVQDPAEDRHEI